MLPFRYPTEKEKPMGNRKTDLYVFGSLISTTAAGASAAAAAG